MLTINTLAIKMNKKKYVFGIFKVLSENGTLSGQSEGS